MTEEQLSDDYVNFVEKEMCKEFIKQMAEYTSIDQEPKYYFEHNGIYNRATNEHIPYDEPVFVFRARDKYAVKALAVYAAFCYNQEHVDAVFKRMRAFERFAEDHPERMKEPDSPA